VGSDTGAGLPGDHFPLIVDLRIRAGRGADGRGGQRRARWDFRAATEEDLAAYDNRVASSLQEVVGAEDVEGAWEVLREAVRRGAEQSIPEMPARPRKPWITRGTMEMIASRQALAALGQLKEARELDRMIRYSAREDRKAWLDEGLKERYWTPIRGMTHKPPPRVVSLVRDGQAQGARLKKPAQVYAEFLAEDQWGRQRDDGAPAPSWDGPLIVSGAAPVADGHITMEELDLALAQASRGKAPGTDGLPSEAWKMLRAGRVAGLALMNRCWEAEEFPTDWGKAVVVGIFEQGAAANPANYRPISLLCTLYKAFGRVMANRLQDGIGEQLRRTQYGFRSGHSTAEPLFIVRRLQDLVQEKKWQTLHLIFLDWSQAFDKVDTRCLGAVLGRFGVPRKVIQVIEALVRDLVFRVSMQGEESEEAGQSTGIRQGCTLSLSFSP